MTYAQQLRKKQDRFLWCIQHLLTYIRVEHSHLTLSTGRARDIPEVQAILVKLGKSSTLDSMHPKGLAWDLNFFLGDYYLFSDKKKKDEDFKMIEPIGAYWETLDKDAQWGGRWSDPFDPYHFEIYFK